MLHAPCWRVGCPGIGRAPKRRRRRHLTLKTHRVGKRWDGALGAWCRVPNRLANTISTDSRGATCLAFSTFGTFLAVAAMAADGRAPIIVINVATGKEVARLKGHSDVIYDLQVPAHTQREK